MSKPKLILIIGLPGTGKTTFANALSESLSMIHLNSDKIRMALGQRGQYSEQAKAQIYQELINQCDGHLQQGESVIIDATFYKDVLRQPYQKIAEQYQLSIYWIELRAEEKNIRNRVEQKRKYSEADFLVYKKIKKEFEPLNDLRLSLRSDQLSLEEMVEKAKEYTSILLNA